MFGRLIANWVYGGFLAGLLLVFLTPVLVALLASYARSYVPLPAGLHDSSVRGARQRQVPVVRESKDWKRRAVSVSCFRDQSARSLGNRRDLSGPGCEHARWPRADRDVLDRSEWRDSRHTGGYRTRVQPRTGNGSRIVPPLGGYGIACIQQAGGGSLLMHLTGALVAIGIHVAIIVHVLRP